MPNYTITYVNFYGDKQSLNALATHVRSDKSVFDFEKVIPMPASLDDEQEVDWSETHWGTKWNAIDSEMTEDSDTCKGYVFQTAWDAPRGVFTALKRLFKGSIYIESIYDDSHPLVEDLEGNTECMLKDLEYSSYLERACSIEGVDGIDELDNIDALIGDIHYYQSFYRKVQGFLVELASKNLEISLHFDCGDRFEYDISKLSKQQLCAKDIEEIKLNSQIFDEFLQQQTGYRFELPFECWKTLIGSMRHLCQDLLAKLA